MYKDKKRTGYMGGMEVKKVDGIMDGNKAARRELREGGKAMKGSQPSYKHGEMPKCMPK
jgi:hypothetical protein